MQYILTSVGLSSITNGLKDVFSPKEIYENSNKQKDEIDKKFLEKFEIGFDKLKNKILSLNEQELSLLSAEINSLLKYNRFEKNDIHRLLCTDTYLGKKAAELIEFFLKNKNLNVSIYKQKDLRTDELDSFRMALADLTKDLSQELQGYIDSNYEIVFNLTGGFKSVNSFLQTMASLYANKSIYIFEGSNELLEIPRLPIKVDEEFIVENYNIFRSLELGILVDEKKVEKLHKTLVLKMYDGYLLSEWGEMVWQKVKNKIYKEKLIEPLQRDKIIYSKRFKKEFESLNPSEKLQLNKTIDKLEKYVAFGENLKSLSYHSVKGEEASKYSHEFYPFDGNESRRAYCNEIDGKIILEKIDPHLK